MNNNNNLFTIFSSLAWLRIFFSIFSSSKLTKPSYNGFPFDQKLKGVETCYSHMFALTEAGEYSFSHVHMYNISNVKKR